jgi:signal transduction histidine kinase
VPSQRARNSCLSLIPSNRLRAADKPYSTMPKQLSVLILEDSIADFELITHELNRFGFNAQCKRVETESDFVAGLRENPDIVLADYSIAGFANIRALEILQESGLVVPLIVLTGAVREEQVVECMKKGAADYLLKDRMIRLGPAIRRALEESDLRRRKLQAEQALVQKNIELEEQYRRAQAANRTKSTFLANMSHELRTPLTAVIGCSEILLDGKVGPLTVEQLDFMQDIVSNGKHLLGLINDILDLTRVDSGMMPFHPEQVHLPDLIRESVAGLRLLATERGIALSADIQMSAMDVYLDPQRLKQVLLNYLSNALKFTPAGGAITVRAFITDDSLLQLEVKDTGIGISTEELELLFQDFHQLDGGLSRNVQGTGLGLALTRRLVEAQGGRVGVASVIGQGCTFFANLPYKPDQTRADLNAIADATAQNSLVSVD